VADQGLTEEEAVSNLKKGLEEHYQVLLELVPVPKGRKLSFLDIEADDLLKLPVVSAKEAIKALEHLGFQVYRQTGSHIHLWYEEINLVVTVPTRSWRRAR